MYIYFIVFSYRTIEFKNYGVGYYPLWCLKSSSPATKKWTSKLCTTLENPDFGELQTFWPRWLAKDVGSKVSCRIFQKS